MTTTIEIKILRIPQAGQAFGFDVFAGGAGLLSVAAVFGQAGLNPGTGLAGTATNVASWLAANHSAPGVVYTLSGSSVFATVTGTEVRAANLRRVMDYVGVYAVDDFADGMADFTVRNFTIEVVDTYDNTRVLVEEFAEADSLALDWDGGDDVFDQPLITSKLTFKMLNTTGDDGVFLHLFTGDETRYLVRLKNTDDNNAVTLLWQGFILPDTYKEPYKGGKFFVEFTATDMLAALKGKTLPEWCYKNTFMLPELLGLILAETGLAQRMYVAPMLQALDVPAWEWKYTNVSLKNFGGDKKNDDVYAVLESVLTAQGLQLLAYRGKWILTGLTRRAAAVIAYEVYHPDGVYIANENVTQTDVSVLWLANPEITPLAQFSSVTMDVEAKTHDNIFPENVAGDDFYLTVGDLNAEGYTADDLAQGYINKMNYYWENVGVTYLEVLNFGPLRFRASKTNPVNAPNYVMTLNGALANYVRCSYRPYIVQGRKYIFTYEVEVDYYTTLFDFVNNFRTRLEDGTHDKTAYYQLFLNGNEFLSNRYANQWGQFQRTYVGVDASQTVIKCTGSFKVEYEFTAPVSGDFEMRVLPPIINMAADITGLSQIISTVKQLKITLVDDISDAETVIAKRPVKSTVTQEISQSLTCTADGLVDNNFRYGGRIFPILWRVPVTEVVQLQHFQRYTVNNIVYAVNLFLDRIPLSSAFVQQLIFMGYGFNECLYLEKAGTENEYFSVYTKTIAGVPYLAAYRGSLTPAFNYKPKLPKDYAEINAAAAVGDVLVLYAAVFANGNLSQLQGWKIIGFPDETRQTYMRSMAYASHCLRPETSFKVEGTALKLVFPLQRIKFNYLEQERIFLPTSIKQNLFGGKTDLNSVENRLTQLNDVSYE